MWTSPGFLRAVSYLKSGWRTAGPFLWGGLAFAAGLGAVCLTLSALLPPREVPQVSPKLAFLKAHREEFDTLFVGSSRIRWQIDPRVFDGICRDRGAEFRSFNLGIDAMAFPELSFYLEQVLETHPRRLKRIFIDLNPERLKMEEGRDERSPRGLWWHDVRRTAVTLQAVLRDPAPAPVGKKGRLACRHLVIMACNLSCFGRGREWYAPVPQSSAADGVGPEGTGFFPLDEALPKSDLGAYESRVREMRELTARPVVADPVLMELHRNLIRQMGSRGIHLYYIAEPTVTNVREYTPDPHRTFEFDNPLAFPRLYDPELRHDLYHLNRRGAEELTRRLAEMFVERFPEGDR